MSEGGIVIMNNVAGFGFKILTSSINRDTLFLYKKNVRLFVVIITKKCCMYLQKQLGQVHKPLGHYGDYKTRVLCNRCTRCKLQNRKGESNREGCRELERERERDKTLLLIDAIPG